MASDAVHFPVPVAAAWSTALGVESSSGKAKTGMSSTNGEWTDRAANGSGRGRARGGSQDLTEQERLQASAPPRWT